MLNTYSIRFYKTNNRVTPNSLNGVDARLFYKQLKVLMTNYEARYEEKLNNDSILVWYNEKEIYRKRNRLNEAGIETVEDMIEYLGIEEPKYIIADNIIISDRQTKLDNIYVLEFYTLWIYLSDEQLKKLGKR